MAYLKRRAEKLLEDALADTRVVVINGARQAGKSTLVNTITRERNGVIERRLDRPGDLESARHDPESFVTHDGLMVIDEIQRAPELVLPIKFRVDEDDRPGQFLITGSARLLGLRSLPDSLVGRSETIELWPFSQGEIDGSSEQFVDMVFASNANFEAAGQTIKADYLARAFRGGFPEATKRDDGRRSRFFESYVNDLIDRDVSQLSDISRRDDLNRLIRLLADRMATPIKVDNLASQSGIPKTTLERYLTLFEEVFLVKRITSWSNSATSRTVRMRKLLFVDSGLGAHLSGITPAKVLRDPSLGGRLLENFVLGELARQLTWSEISASLCHFRDRDGGEVDAVLEANDGRIVGIEVKASNTVIAKDFRHLANLQRAVPDQFHHGIILYTGKQTLPFGLGLLAVPLDALWLC